VTYDFEFCVSTGKQHQSDITDSVEKRLYIRY